MVSLTYNAYDYLLRLLILAAVILFLPSSAAAPKAKDKEKPGTTTLTRLTLTEGILDLGAANHKTVIVNGDVTLAGGQLEGGNGGTLVTYGNITSSGTLLGNSPNIEMAPQSGVLTTITGATPLLGVGEFIKTGAGTVRLDQAVYATELHIEAGTLLLGASERLNNNLPVHLGGTLATSGFEETLGTLTLIGTGATLDLGSGSSGTLTFADSSSANWQKDTLTIVNYSDATDQIFFGTTSQGLTPSQLENIVWMDPYGPGSGIIYGAAISANGRIRPVPEPGTITSIVAVAALIAWRERAAFKRYRD
ncbi:MAG TPA: hypothetical protein VEH27_18505 [Methylomirabilota bacterium]|nr:hypothetical protein [Methylomirabilota bacterium]